MKNITTQATRPRDLPFSGVTDLGGLKGDTPGEGGGVGVLLSSG